MQITSYKYHLGLVAIIALSVVAFFSFATPARAEDGASGDVHIQVQTHSEDGTTTIETETETHGTASSTSEGDTGRRDNGSGQAMGTSSSHGEEVSNERNKGQQGEAMATEQAGGKMEFDRDSEDMQASSTVSDPEKVKNDSDLRDFATGVFEHNKHVTHIDVSTTSVAAEFDSPARLFGIFPVNIPARVDVSHDGSVGVTYPWYALFFATNKDAIEQAVASSTSNVSVGASVSLSAGQQATLVHSIMSALQDLFGFSGSASTTATAL